MSLIPLHRTTLFYWEGGRGTGDGGAGAREKKGWEGGSLRRRYAREKFEKESFRLSSSQRNEPKQLPFNVLRGLKQNFICEKNQKTKILTRDKKKKTALLPFKLEIFPSRLHHKSRMRWHNTCTRVSTVSVVSVSRLSR